MYTRNLAETIEKIISRKITIDSNIFPTSKNASIIYVEETPSLLKKLLDFNKIVVRVPLIKFNLKNCNPRPRILTVHDGSQRVGQSPSEAKNFQNRGLRLIEGLWLITFYPEILKNHSIDLVESVYSKECIPTIYLWDDAINLSAICPDVSDSMCGAPYVLEERTL